MANTITNLTTSNTFLQWLTGTQSIISSLNSLREGGVANTYVVNTSIEIAGDLVVSGNLTSDGGLLNASSNVFVNDWVFSANANVRPGITTFSVVNAGSAAYLFDQYPGNNPDIYLHPGQTVSFNINASGHPFLIRQSAGGTLYNIGLTHVSTTGVVSTGSDAQAKQTGTLIWKVPFSLVNNTYVYQCQVHSGMVGNLIIQNTVTASAGDSLAFAIALG